MSNVGRFYRATSTDGVNATGPDGQSGLNNKRIRSATSTDGRTTLWTPT